MDKEIVISIKTVLFTFLIVAGIYVLYRLGPILGILVVSALFVFSIESMINFVMKGTLFNRPIPRNFAVILSYLIVIVLIVSSITVILPTFLIQAQKLIKGLSSIAMEYGITNKVDFTLPDLLPQAKSISGGVIDITVSLFSNLTSIFSVLIISLYMSLDWINIKKRLIELFSEKYQEMAEDTLKDIESEIGHWIKGELALMFIVGLFGFIGLSIIDVDYALALGLISGLLEIVPMIGPIIATILAGVVGFVESPVKGIGAVALFVVIQQLENNILVPQVMKKVSGFSPLVILIALLVGSEFFGILGAVMAVPIIMIGVLILKRVLGYRA